MNLVHLHLMINHFPVIGFVLTFFILVYALWSKNEQIIRAGLFLIVIVGIFSAFAYFTGEPAEEAVEHLPGISERYIEAHEEKAEIAFIFSVITSLVALATLLFSFQKVLGKVGIASVVVLNLITSLFMGWTANLGGEIRHPEIRSGNDAKIFQDGSHDRDDD